MQIFWIENKKPLETSSLTYTRFTDDIMADRTYPSIVSFHVAPDKQVIRVDSA